MRRVLTLLGATGRPFVHYRWAVHGSQPAHAATFALAMEVSPLCEPVVLHIGGTDNLACAIADPATWQAARGWHSEIALYVACHEGPPARWRGDVADMVAWHRPPLGGVRFTMPVP